MQITKDKNPMTAMTDNANRAYQSAVASKNIPGMIRLLSERIAAASDNGLASAVYLYRWMNYREATSVLSALKDTPQ